MELLANFLACNHQIKQVNIKGYHEYRKIDVKVDEEKEFSDNFKGGIIDRN